MSEPQKEFVVDFVRALLHDFTKSSSRRSSVGISGPSGSGKSFLSVLAREIGMQIDPGVDIVPLSIDAFHFDNHYLENTEAKDGKTLKDAKGRSDTYDVSDLIQRLQKFNNGETVSFPEYSRLLHEPIKDRITVTDRPTILLLEGLWLLYKGEGWGSISPLLQKTFYLESSNELSRERTIGRHVMGGRTMDDAERFYEQSDRMNASLVVGTKKYAHEILAWPN